MSSIIKIKRSSSTAQPPSLASGELAYSWESSTGGKLFIGWGAETTPGEADNIDPIGGKYYTDKLNHTPGVLTANAALIVDANSKLDSIIIDDITIDSSTISSNTTITLSSSGNIDVSSSRIVNVGTPTANTDAATKEYVDGIVLTIAGDSGTDTVSLTQDTLTIAGNTGITVAVTDNQIDIDLDDTAVTPGSYGSITEIPVLTIDQQGRITAANTVVVSTELNIAGDTGTDTVSLLNDTLVFAGNTGISVNVTDNQVDIDLNDTTVAPGSYGSSTEIPVITIDQQGRITLANTASISTDLSIAGDVGTDTVSLLNDTLTVSGNSGITVTVTDNQIDVDLDDTAVIPGTYGTSNEIPVFTVDQQGRITSANTITVATTITIGNTTIELGDFSGDLTGLESLEVDNIRIDGNTISSINTDGNIILDPNGTGVVSVSGARIEDVALPVNDTDAANKLYVDEVAQGLQVKGSVEAATTVDLGGTYNNGNNGIGSTITLSANTTLDIDGWTTWSEFDGVLVKDQTNPEENGRYFVSTVGDANTAWVLTRCTACDEPDEIIGMFVFVSHGDTYESTGWVATVTDVDTFAVGVDAITWVQFSGAGTYEAGDGLDLTGTVFSVNVDDSTIEIVTDTLQVKDGGITNAKLENDHYTISTDGTGSNFDIQLGDTWNFNEGEGINIALTADTITISGEDASSTNKGIASFSNTDFIVTSGDVELRDEAIQDIVGAFVVPGTAIQLTYYDASNNTLEVAATLATTTEVGVASFAADNFAVDGAGEVTVTTVDGGTY